MAGLLTRLRVQAGLTQATLAEKSGVGRSTIAHIEAGDGRTPRPHTIGLLADALGLDEADRAALLGAVSGDRHGTVPAVPGRARDVQSTHRVRSATPILAPRPTAQELLASWLDRRGTTVRQLARQAGMQSDRTLRDVLARRQQHLGVASAARVATALGLTDADDYERRLLLAVLIGTELPRNPLPPQIEGRQHEYDALLALLHSRRLVTVTGPAGVGKTVLAQAAGRTLPDGVVGYALAQLPPGMDAREALAVLTPQGAGRGDDPLDRVASTLDPGATVLLDTLEHLDQAAAAVTELLERRPDIRILSTSRAALGVPSETVFPLRPLSVEDARAMFLRRAESAGRPVNPGSDPDVVDRICLRLDCLPLAIALAANRAGMLTPEEILTGLDRPAAMLRAPTERGAQRRHSTLETAVRWSLDLVSEPAQRLFAEMSAYPVRWTSELLAAVHVDLDVLDCLTTLVDHHLVRAEPTSTLTWFTILQPLRDIGVRRLCAEPGLEAAVRARHARHLLAVAEQAAADLTDDAAVNATLASTDALLPHHLNAIDFLIDARSPDAVRLSGALSRYWLLRDQCRAGLAVIRRTLAVAPTGEPDPHARGRAHQGAAILAHMIGENDAARADIEKALACYVTARDRTGVGDVEGVLAGIQLRTGDPVGAAATYERAIRAVPWSVDRRVSTTLLSSYAPVQLALGDLAGAIRTAEDAYGHFLLLDDVRGASAVLADLALWTAYVGDVPRARERLDDLLAILAETGDAAELRKAHRTLAEIAVDLGEVALADPELQRATAAVGGQVEDQWNKAACAVLTAEALFLRGDVRGSRSALGRAGALADHLGDPKSRARVALVRTVLAVHAGQLGSAIAHAREGLAICGAGEPRVAVSLGFLLDALAAPVDPAEVSARRRWPTTTPCAAASLGAAALDTRRSGAAHE